MLIENVDDAAAQREFRSDDGEIDAFTFGSRSEHFYIERIDRDGARRLCDTRIARNSDDGMVLRQFPRQRVLTATAANDKNPHDDQVSLLFRVGYSECFRRLRELTVAELSALECAVYL